MKSHGVIAWVVVGVIAVGERFRDRTESSNNAESSAYGDHRSLLCGVWWLDHAMSLIGAFSIHVIREKQ